MRQGRHSSSFESLMTRLCTPPLTLLREAVFDSRLGTLLVEFIASKKVYKYAQLVCHLSKMGGVQLLASAQRHSSPPYASPIISKLSAGASASNHLSTSLFQTHLHHFSPRLDYADRNLSTSTYTLVISNGRRADRSTLRPKCGFSS